MIVQSFTRTSFFLNCLCEIVLITMNHRGKCNRSNGYANSIIMLHRPTITLIHMLLYFYADKRT
jgi:hypothetical protein